MRILFYEPERDWSGRARAFHDAARALASRGYDVVVGVATPSRLEDQARATGLAVAAVEPARGALGRARALRQAVHDFFVDVVFVHGEREHLSAAMAVRMARRASVVRRVEAGAAPVIGWRTRVAARLAAVTWLLTDAHGGEPGTVTAPEPIVRGGLGVRLEDAEVVPPANGAALRMACLAEGRARHRASQALRAAALLLERHPDVTLSIAGTAARLDELRLHAAALGVAGRVQWCGDDGGRHALRGAGLAWVLADADAAVFGCLDAMAAAVPVFAERTPLTARLITAGVEGELFAALDPWAMAAAASEYLLQRGRSADAGRAGRRRVEREYTERELANGFEHAARAAREAERAREPS
jgi:hypothetical protein